VDWRWQARKIVIEVCGIGGILRWAMDSQGTLREVCEKGTSLRKEAVLARHEVRQDTYLAVVGVAVFPKRPYIFFRYIVNVTGLQQRSS
jgi:hypothetical protein